MEINTWSQIKANASLRYWNGNKHPGFYLRKYGTFSGQIICVGYAVAMCLQCVYIYIPKYYIAVTKMCLLWPHIFIYVECPATALAITTALATAMKWFVIRYL